MKKIYVIGIGGIGISAIARYYNQLGYQVFGSDKIDSELIHNLQKEGIDVFIGERPEIFNPGVPGTTGFDLIIYTEAISKNQIELLQALKLGIKTQTYPESLAEIANTKKLIGIAGTHGKSTTTSMIGIMLKNSKENINAVVGSIIKEFDGKNAYFSDSEYFVLEACEYKRSFLAYKPFIGIITNIDLDHLDYYKDLDDYMNAFENYVKNIIPGGYLILNGDCKNSLKLIGLRNDINYVLIYDDRFEIKGQAQGIAPTKNVGVDLVSTLFPKLKLKIPGEHILFDAYIAFVVGKIVGLQDKEIIKSLENYNGIWRRSEIIGMTENGNILMSDYGHHPTEISLNLGALKEKYSSLKILTIFQPHQYSRTLELLDDFKKCFFDTDILIISDIYESRDSEENKKKISGKKLVDYINHPNKIWGNGKKNTLNLIEKFDKENPEKLVIILQGAGDIDDLRYKIKAYN